MKKLNKYFPMEKIIFTNSNSNNNFLPKGLKTHFMVMKFIFNKNKTELKHILLQKFPFSNRTFQMLNSDLSDRGHHFTICSLIDFIEKKQPEN